MQCAFRCAYARLMPFSDGYTLWYCLLRSEEIVFPGPGCSEVVAV